MFGRGVDISDVALSTTSAARPRRLVVGRLATAAHAVESPASIPGGKEFWGERGYVFGPDFQQHVESDIMKRKPHPAAKPLGAFGIGEVPRSEEMAART